MKILAFIPARGGSKGVPKKNIKLLNGKPLIYYTIEAARAVFEDTDIFVSTDSEEIKNIVEKTGLQIPFLRPKEFATDTANTEGAILQILDYYHQKGISYDAVIELQPTSPFRKGYHIKEAIKLFSKDVDMVVSVKETESNPYFVLFEENKEGFLEKTKIGNFIRRQDCPKVWEYNGAIYIMNVDTLKQKTINQFEKVIKYVMKREFSIDIDTKLDFKIAELLMKIETKEIKE